MNKKKNKSGLLARVIKTAAMRNGMTLELLAQKLDKSPSAISSIINGNPTIASLKEIAEACDMKVALVTDKSIIHL